MSNQAIHANEPIVLWGVSISPYVRKVQIALEEKNIPYEHKQILPSMLLTATKQSIPAEFAKASPLGKIPALQVGAHCIADSAVICNFLDKKYNSGQRLYPNDPALYARALWFENYADNIFSSIAYKKIFVEAVVKPKVLGIAPDKEIVEHAKSHELPACLDYLEMEVSKHRWLAGDDFSMADIAITTQLISLEQAGFILDSARWKNLHNHKAKVMARDSVKKVLGN